VSSCIAHILFFMTPRSSGKTVVSSGFVSFIDPPCAVLRSPAGACCAAFGFFRDFRGREMAAGVQAAGISDDRKTERTYLNMEAR
jgi:hypothetical protein